MARVELDGIGKRYENGFEAVETFSMDIACGEFVVLVGPSGCGKSTTLRMVAGLESITTGELRIDGRRVNELPPKARDIAMVFQSYALYPHMTAYDNLAFALTLQKVPKAEIRTRVLKVAEQLDITALLDRKPKAMSGGQRQRIAIGRAIIRKPKVFLFDEPLSNLDARLRLQMRVELSRLHRSQGATSLYVTHDQVEAMTLADRIVLLSAGKVQQIGPPLELYDRPANRFVATFIGSPGMNLMAGTVQDGAVLVAGSRLPLPPGTEVQTGQAVEVGIRPEHLSLHRAAKDAETSDAAAASGAPARIPATVELVEPMGNESYVHLRGEAGALVVRTVGSHAPVATGDAVWLGVDAPRLHVFDAADQRRR